MPPLNLWNKLVCHLQKAILTWISRVKKIVEKISLSHGERHKGHLKFRFCRWTPSFGSEFRVICVRILIQEILNVWNRLRKTKNSVIRLIKILQANSILKADHHDIFSGIRIIKAFWSYAKAKYFNVENE